MVIVVLIIVAPWKRIREEPPLDPVVETKLLLHLDPDEPTGEFRALQLRPDDAGTDTVGALTDSTGSSPRHDQPLGEDQLRELARLADPDPSTPGESS